jgi:hypothetical protein
MKVRVEIVLPPARDEAIDSDEFNRIVDLLRTLREFDSHGNTQVFDVYFVGDFKI